METFKIEVEEILSRVVEVAANSVDEAIEKIKKSYFDEELILAADDFISVDIKSI